MFSATGGYRSLLWDKCCCVCRVFVEWGRLQYLGLPQASCGGLRHQGNVPWARSVGKWGLFSLLSSECPCSPLTPPSQRLFCSQWRWLHCVPGVYYWLLLQFILLRNFCRGPEHVVYSDACLGSVVFWHHISHLLTGQPPLVLYSTVSLLPSVMARHRNLAPLPPLLLPPSKSFSERSTLSFFLTSLLCSRHAGLVPRSLL